MKEKILFLGKKMVNKEIQKIENGRCIMFCYKPEKPKKLILKNDHKII